MAATTPTPPGPPVAPSHPAPLSGSSLLLGFRCSLLPPSVVGHVETISEGLGGPGAAAHSQSRQRLVMGGEGRGVGQSEPGYQDWGRRTPCTDRAWAPGAKVKQKGRSVPCACVFITAKPLPCPPRKEPQAHTHVGEGDILSRENNVAVEELSSIDSPKCWHWQPACWEAASPQEGAVPLAEAAGAVGGRAAGTTRCSPGQRSCGVGVMVRRFHPGQHFAPSIRKAACLQHPRQGLPPEALLTWAV